MCPKLDLCSTQAPGHATGEGSFRSFLSLLLKGGVGRNYEILPWGFKGETFFQSWLLSIPYKSSSLLFLSGGIKELAKGFRFKMAWNLPAQILTGRGKKCRGGGGGVSEPYAHKSAWPWIYNPSDPGRLRSLPLVHKGLPEPVLFVCLSLEIDSEKNSVQSPGNKRCKNKYIRGNTESL